ncbi:DUF3868 domain-containing protein [Bacteroides thetaiotaomicron]|jgi:hypothetical protein|uniref:DUF3868 domain-containing protein n=1 Tax=Bacteroides thetaiotaomicron TaxID=818 RepID=UPI00232C5B9E|nr:DUF3868 domain-containing protein [Bacteroides thetaiotaomicron]MCS2305873.1 DUF3868 domain-containing protein [Bacteroides thetaiotaomicron]MDC2258427.1 DUF3868 domain-containing protein [Bacteroides thetaiotaomicron]MDC2261337.1 DUF3868 domain-containing protein [Bacteroides thetaiotaomicron]
MKRTIFILAILLGIGNMLKTMAQSTRDIIPGVSIENFNMNREGKYLTVEMNLDLNKLNVDANRAVLLTPRLVNGMDSLDLPSVGIYGRRRYYYYVRNGIGSISGENETVYRVSDKPDNVAYNNLAEYEGWMDGATLKFHRSDWGCCHEILVEYEGILGRHREAFFPKLVFVQPKAEIMKSRSLSGSAYIDFPVDQTVIYPDYRRNTVELGKIQATIDSVRNDKDVSITSVWLKGFASPESPYKHNTELAIGRTAALKKHIGQLYHFADSIIQTDYEPEDWEGLRRYVEQSNINHREKILTMIDSDMEPDAKETKIKRTYPEEYRFMLQHFYPALRHTDYRINYTIRTFSEVEEIKRIMTEQPQKLSLNEFYLVAQKYEPGTVEFTDVFETAVRIFPNDTIANLNAANAAIRRDDYVRAEQYLEKAGDIPEAVYARAALAIRKEDYETARRYLETARDMGLEQAATTLNELNERQKR